jgi:hypothetical protein
MAADPLDEYITSFRKAAGRGIEDVAAGGQKPISEYR